MQPWLDWFQAEYEDVRILKQTAASRIGLCRHRKTGMELVRLDLENTNEEVYRAAPAVGAPLPAADL